MNDIVIVPIYNEAATLRAVLGQIHTYYDGALLAIDDGSCDDTADILADYPGIELIRHEKNRGYGASLKSGFEYAIANRFDRAITIDCDEQHEPALIPKMFGALSDGVDLVSGSRYLDESLGGDDAPVDRRKVNLAITELINEITGFGLTDSFCGFKCYRVESLNRLTLDEPGYAMPLQFWIQAKHFGLTVKEIPIPRIYKNLNRSFGGPLDDAELRLAYYRRVIEKECKRWSTCSSSELIQTI